MLQKAEAETYRESGRVLQVPLSVQPRAARIRAPHGPGRRLAADEQSTRSEGDALKLIYADPHPIPDTTPAALQMLQTADALGEVGYDVTVLSSQVRSGTTPAHILDRALAPNETLRYLPDLRKRWFFPVASHRPYALLAAMGPRRCSSPTSCGLTKCCGCPGSRRCSSRATNCPHRRFAKRIRTPAAMSGGSSPRSLGASGSCTPGRAALSP